MQRADVTRPDTAERLPVILVRVPYGKHMLGCSYSVCGSRFDSDGNHDLAEVHLRLKQPVGRDRVVEGKDAVDDGADLPQGERAQ